MRPGSQGKLCGGSAGSALGSIAGRCGNKVQAGKFRISGNGYRQSCILVVVISEYREVMDSL